MKKIIYLLLLVVIIYQYPVHAANYEMKELIPIDLETTVKSDHFTYSGVYYNSKDTVTKDTIIFKSIINLTEDARPITFSIGLFDEEKLNIGTINYCSKDDTNSEFSNVIIESKGSKNFMMKVTKNHLGDEKKLSDIKYIAFLSDNINCRNDGNDENVGLKIEDIGVRKNGEVDSLTKNFITILTILGIFLVAFFVYLYMGTSAYQNMDGEDTRTAFKYQNKVLDRERKLDRIKNPPKEPEKVQIKTDKVLEQEKKEANKSKDDTDLHDFFS